MTDHTTALDRLFPTGDSFQDLHSAMNAIKCFNIDEISRRPAMFRNENGFVFFLEIRNQLCGMAFKCCDELCFHKVTLKYHFTQGVSNLGLKSKLGSLLRPRGRSH